MYICSGYQWCPLFFMRTKSLISAVSSAIICTLYICATVGFDIHSDHHDNRIYISSLLRGTDCADIHPEDECSCIASHETGERHSHEHPSDCTDEVEILSLTGTDTSDQSPDISPVSITVSLAYPVFKTTAGSHDIHKEKQQTYPPAPLLDLFCILRV